MTNYKSVFGIWFFFSVQAIESCEFHMTDSIEIVHRELLIRGDWLIILMKQRHRDTMNNVWTCVACINSDYYYYYCCYVIIGYQLILLGNRCAQCASKISNNNKKNNIIICCGRGNSGNSNTTTSNARAHMIECDSKMKIKPFGYLLVR